MGPAASARPARSCWSHGLEVGSPCGKTFGRESKGNKEHEEDVWVENVVNRIQMCRLLPPCLLAAFTL